MTNKTQTPAISLRTLSGVFEQPKMNHRRDFLRENKLSLRELQKTTIQKLTQQKQDHEGRQYKHLQKFHKSQEQMSRRSPSQRRSSDQNSKRQFKITAGSVEEGGGKPNNLAFRRAYSQQLHKVENVQTASTCCCIQQQKKIQPIDSQYHERVPRSVSSVSVSSKAESCDKEIQTEDIHDELFLYEALKKCSSSDVHLLHKQKSIDQLNARGSNPQHDHSTYDSQQYKYEPELNSIHSREGAAYVSQCRYEDNKSHRNQILQHTPRSHIQEGEIANGVGEDLDQHFGNLKIAANVRESELQSSARSRQTLCSISTKRSGHKLGNREDVLLPRYLEKEKREKEEERMRELSKDRNCPLGHYALSEKERLKALNTAQQKMTSLINELNHMPMTMETLRIRNRKVEIEKELTQIEFDIRLYSKPKVYIPKTPIQY